MIKNIYVLLKNNVVIKKKVNKNTRKAANTMWMMDCQIKWLHIADTAMAKWASTERQRFLVMRPGKSHLQ